MKTCPWTRRSHWGNVVKYLRPSCGRNLRNYKQHNPINCSPSCNCAFIIVIYFITLCIRWKHTVLLNYDWMLYFIQCIENLSEKFPWTWPALFYISKVHSSINIAYLTLVQIFFDRELNHRSPQNWYIITVFCFRYKAVIQQSLILCNLLSKSFRLHRKVSSLKWYFNWTQFLCTYNNMWVCSPDSVAELLNFCKEQADNFF